MNGLEELLSKIEDMRPKLSIKDSRAPRYLGDRIRAFIDLTRPATLLGAFVAGLSTAVLYSGFFQIPLNLQLGVIAGLCLALFQAGGQSLNQSLPEEIAVDIANEKSYRPTVRGIISPSEAKAFALLLFLVGAIVSFQTNILFGLFSLTIVFFAFFYTMPPLRAKKHFLLSNIWQGIARGFLPIVTVWGLSPQPFHPFPLALGFVIGAWCCGAQATKDLSDIPGDALYGIRTFFVVLGKERAVGLVGMLMAFSFTTLVLFIVGGILPVNYLWLLLLSVPSIFILRTLRNPITLHLLENQLSWVLFYAVLGLFYVLSAILVRPC